jgi:hypothetical protein
MLIPAYWMRWYHAKLGHVFLYALQEISKREKHRNIQTRQLLIRKDGIERERSERKYMNVYRACVPGQLEMHKLPVVQRREWYGMHPANLRSGLPSPTPGYSYPLSHVLAPSVIS